MSTAPIWLGVLGAVTLSGAFAAVLTFSVSVLTSAGQEAVGGLLSVLAVGLVTAMIFWMRRTAATLSAHLRGEVERAAAVGAGALTLTAFLSVGREGLETTLFLWTAAKASGQTAGPLVGAAIGIAAAVILCWLLYRRAVHLNVGVFFNRTAIALIVIAAGRARLRPRRPAGRGLAARPRLGRLRPDRAHRPGLLVGVDHHRHHRAVAQDDRPSGHRLARLPRGGHPRLRQRGPRGPAGKAAAALRAGRRGSGQRSPGQHRSGQLRPARRDPRAPPLGARRGRPPVARRRRR